MRSIQAGLVYHVLNRGNGRMRLFHKDADFAAFQNVLAEGLEHYPVALLTYCLMGNHWHLVMRPLTKKGVRFRFSKTASTASGVSCLTWLALRPSPLLL